MIADFLKRLFPEDTAQKFTEKDARLALVGLLVRIARSDGDYAPAEIHRIDRISMARYGLSAAQAAALRADAEQIEAEAPDTVRFTRAIKEAVPYEHRIGVVEAMWEVVLADGHRENEEDALMRMVVSFLGVSDVESAEARQRVQSIP